MAYLHRFESGVAKCDICGGINAFDLHHAAPCSICVGSRWQQAGNLWRGLFTCTNCRTPTLIEFRLKASADTLRFQDVQGFLNRLKPVTVMDRGRSPNQYRALAIASDTYGDTYGCDLSQWFDVTARFPAGDAIPVGPVPPAIARMYKEAAETSATSGRMAMMGCRMVIEMVCRERLPDAAGHKPLRDLIDLMMEDLEIAAEIRSWAHTIRILGNEAVHDGSQDVAKGDAQEALQFTRLLIEMIYSHPQRIRALRGEPVHTDSSVR